jgi:hypothetical protein
MRVDNYIDTFINKYRSALNGPFPDQSRSDNDLREKHLMVISRLLLLVAIAIPFLGLLPELVYPAPDINDGTFHLGVAKNTIAAVREGANPLDFWVPTWLNGFPLFQYYQPGPYLFITLLHILSAGTVSLLFIYRLITLLAIVAFPLANYRALRWLGFPALTASWGALFSTLISAHAKYGIEFESFTWSGWGLFTQLVALPFLPLVLAGGYRAIKEGKRTIGYAALFAMATLSHILYGYIAALSLIIIPFLELNSNVFRKCFTALLRFGMQSFGFVAFFVIPLMMYRAYHLKSLYDEASKFDSHGAKKILAWFLSGELFDAGRLPVLTCLIIAGLYLSCRKWIEQKSHVHGWIVCGFVFWLFLYFGRATWGPLINFLPMSQGLHFERLSSGVHIFGIWLAAMAFGSMFRWALSFRTFLPRWVAGGLLCALIIPAVAERSQYLIQNTKNVQAEMKSNNAEQPYIGSILHLLREDPEGRVFAGHSGNWGSAYKVGSVQVYQVLSAEAISTATHAPFSWSLSTDVGFQFSPNEWESYDLYNVRYLLTNQAWLIPPRSDLLLQSGPHRLFRIKDIQPFSIVSLPVSVIGNKDTTPYLLIAWAKSVWSRKSAHLQLIYGGEQPLGEKTLKMEDLFHFSYEGGSGKLTRNIFDPPDLFMTQPASPPSGSISDTFLSRQEARANIHLDSPGVILFKTTYHPNWQAELDGKKVSTMLLSPAFIGIQVPEGTHTLRMTYKSGWLKLILLLVGIMGAFGVEMFSNRGGFRGQKSER